MHELMFLFHLYFKLDPLAACITHELYIGGGVVSDGLCLVT